MTEIVFNSLQRQDIHKIIDLSLGKLFARITQIGYNVELTEKAKDFLAEKGYDHQFGARPLNRAIQKYLEDPVAEEILKGEIEEGGTILADYEGKGDNLTIKVKKAMARKELMKLLEEHPMIEVVGEAINADEAYQMINELNPADTKKILADNNLGRLGCISEGEPYVVPVYLHFDGECIHIHSLPG